MNPTRTASARCSRSSWDSSSSRSYPSGSKPSSLAVTTRHRALLVRKLAEAVLGASMRCAVTLGVAIHLNRRRV